MDTKITRFTQLILFVLLTLEASLNAWSQPTSSKLILGQKIMRTATVLATVNSDGRLGNFVIADSGDGYFDTKSVIGWTSFAPTITRRGGGNPDYTNNLTFDCIKDGKIVAIQVEDNGSFYCSGFTSAPQIEIESPQAVIANLNKFIGEAQASIKKRIEDKENQMAQLIKSVAIGVGAIVLACAAIFLWAKKSKSFSEKINADLGGSKMHAFIIIGAIILGIAIYGFYDLKKIKTSGGRETQSSANVSHKSAEQLIKDYAKDQYGSGANVEVDAMGGAYQVTVRTRVVGGQYDGGINDATYTVTVDTSSQAVTSWNLDYKN